MTEYHVLGAAFVGGAVALAWLAVLLKRELEAIWSETLDGVADHMR